MWKQYTFLLLLLGSRLIAVAQVDSLPIEKIYIHFDRPSYSFGDTCRYKAYVIAAPELSLSTVSGVLYVDWLDQDFNVIEQQRLKVTAGVAEGNFAFNHTPSGIYVARAYTRWMRNFDPAFFFKQAFDVAEDSSSHPSTSVSKNNAIHVSFHPEGGRLVQNIPTKLALRTANEFGEGIDVEADVVNESGQIISSLQTTNGGMVAIPYVPGNKKYWLKLPSGDRVAFPAADEEGVVMNINNADTDKLFISFSRSDDFERKDFTLIGFHEGRRCFTSDVVLKKNLKQIVVSKRDLPSGIIQLSLFDEKGSLHCERFIFIDNTKKHHIQVAKRIQNDSISLDLKTLGPDSNAWPISLSASLLYDNLGVTGNTLNTIFPYLLLIADCKTSITLSAERLNVESKQNNADIDLMMLTHDWRRTDWDSKTNKLSKPFKYRPEKGIAIQGTAKNAGSKKPISEGAITLVVDDRYYKGIYTGKTDSIGNFRIEDIDFGDSTVLVWQVQDNQGRTRPIEIELDDVTDIPKVDSTIQLLVASHLARRNTLQVHLAADSVDGNFQLLEEVIVEVAKKKVRSLGAGSILVTPGADDQNLNASQFLSSYIIGLPFLTPVTLNDQSVVWVTTSGAAVKLFIDGYRIDEPGSGINPFHYLLAYSTDEINNVIVTGNNRNGYIISVATKKDRDRSRRNFVQKYARGYTFFRPFDGRHYWNANLLTDDKKAATVGPFALSNENVSVLLQGVGDNGEVIDLVVPIVR